MRFSGLHPLRCIKAQHDFFRYSPDSQCLAGSSVSIYPLRSLLGFHLTPYFFFSLGMLSKTYSAPIFLLASTTSVNAQAVVAPTLGVKRVPAVTDVQRPSIDVEPCGDVDIPQNLDICTATLANASGCHFPFIITFNL